MTSEKPPSLEEEEAQVRRVTASQHQAELGLIEKLLNAYLAGFRSLGSFTPSDNNELEYAWLLLITRAFNSMRCAYDLLQRGYYSQTLTLVRSVNEDWLTCMDCLINRPTLEALLQGRKMPAYGDMAKRLEEPESKKWWDHIYGEQSQLAHARRRALTVLVDPDTHTLRLGGHYDKDLFVASCYSLIPAAARMTEFLGRVLGSRAQPWANESLPIVREAQAWMKRVEAEVLDPDSPHLT